MTPAECRALKRAAQRVEQAMAERNQLIREVHENGSSVREIAACLEAIGYSAVFKVIKAGSGD